MNRAGFAIVLALAASPTSAQEDYALPQDPKIVTFLQSIDIGGYIDFASADLWPELKSRMNEANPGKTEAVAQVVTAAKENFRNAVLQAVPHTAATFAAQQKLSINRAITFSQSSEAMPTRLAIPPELTICFVKSRSECGEVTSAIAAARRSGKNGKLDFILALGASRAGALAMMQLAMASGDPTTTLDPELVKRLGLKRPWEAQSDE